MRMFNWLHNFLESKETSALIKTNNPFKTCRFMYERYKTMGAVMVDNQSIVINKKHIMFDQNDLQHVKTIGVM